MEEKRANESGKEVEVVTGWSRLQQHELMNKHLKGKVLKDEYDAKLGRATVDPDLFITVRRKKDREELARIEKASEKLDTIYGALESWIRPGRTEREVAADVMKLAIEEGLSPLGAEGSLSPIIIASGENGSYPHAELSDRKLRQGDMVVADIFFRYDGYCSDCTRTYAVGHVSQQMRDVYQAVLDAEAHGVGLAGEGRLRQGRARGRDRGPEGAQTGPALHPRDGPRSRDRYPRVSLHRTHQRRPSPGGRRRHGRARGILPR